MKGAYLGPAFPQDGIERRLAAAGARLDVLDDDELLSATAPRRWRTARRSAGSRDAWSSVPARSAPARFSAMPARPPCRSILNLKVKYRESFRPFAPSVLREDVADWFELDFDSPYMLLVADVVEARRQAMTAEEEALFGIDKLNVPRTDIPAVTHVDYSARVQTVHARPIRASRPDPRFKERTGCPVIVNTSFNVRGEPIVVHSRGRVPLFHGHRN